MIELEIEAIAEDRPGPKWRASFDRHWHAYSRWFIHDGLKARPTYLTSRRALKTHMPELVPVYEAMVETAGGGDLEARFLSMWCPPVYVGGCSQLAIGGPSPCLIRNYDYSPRLFEGLWWASRLLGRRVLAVSDCLWGVLDGINEDGLCLSLAFGGRTVAGEGFGIPLVLRYVLECAADCGQAIEILRRVPVHMSYTVTILDRRASHATVFVNPDRPIEVLDRREATNHQHRIEWQRHATATRSMEREAALRALAAANADEAATAAAFLRAPLFQSAYSRGFGTLYSIAYWPEQASARMFWPQSEWRQSCADFHEGQRLLQFRDSDSAAPSFKIARSGYGDLSL